MGWRSIVPSRAALLFGSMIDFLKILESFAQVMLKFF
jgi:hypothetical protein